MNASLINRVIQSGLSVVVLVVCIILYIGVTKIQLSVNGVNAVFQTTTSTSMSVLVGSMRELLKHANIQQRDTALKFTDETTAIGKSISSLGVNAMSFTNLSVDAQAGAFVFPVVASAVTISSHFWLYLVSGLGLVDSIINIAHINRGGMHGLSTNQVVYILTLSLSDAVCAILWFVAAFCLAVAYGGWDCSTTTLLLTQFKIVQSTSSLQLLSNFYGIFQLNENTNSTEFSQIMSYLQLTPALVQRANSDTLQLTTQSDMVIKLSESCLTRQALLGVCATTFLTYICSSSVLIVAATRFFLAYLKLREASVKPLIRVAESLFDFESRAHPVPSTTHDSEPQFCVCSPFLFPTIINNKSIEEN